MLTRLATMFRWLLSLPDLIRNARHYRLEAASLREANRLLVDQLQRRDALIFEQREEIKYLREFPKRFPRTAGVWANWRGEA